MAWYQGCPDAMAWQGAWESSPCVQRSYLSLRMVREDLGHSSSCISGHQSLREERDRAYWRFWRPKVFREYEGIKNSKAWIAMRSSLGQGIGFLLASFRESNKEWDSFKIIFHLVLLYYVVLYYVALNYVALYYIVLYYVVLYYAVLRFLKHHLTSDGATWVLTSGASHEQDQCLGKYWRGVVLEVLSCTPQWLIWELHVITSRWRGVVLPSSPSNGKHLSVYFYISPILRLIFT